jgi:hypothetical protein
VKVLLSEDDAIEWWMQIVSTTQQGTRNQCCKLEIMYNYLGNYSARFMCHSTQINKSAGAIQRAGSFRFFGISEGS